MSIDASRELVSQRNWSCRALLTPVQYRKRVDDFDFDITISAVRLFEHGPSWPARASVRIDDRKSGRKSPEILERAEKQFGNGRSAATPQVRSSVLDLPMSLPWVKGIFDGTRLSEFLSSLRPHTLAWSAIAAAVVILVQAAVITAVLVKGRDAPSGPSLAMPGIDILPRATQHPTQTALAPDVLFEKSRLWRSRLLRLLTPRAN